MSVYENRILWYITTDVRIYFWLILFCTALSLSSRSVKSVPDGRNPAYIISRGVCMNRHVIFSFVYHTFIFLVFYHPDSLRRLAKLRGFVRTTGVHDRWQTNVYIIKCCIIIYRLVYCTVQAYYTFKQCIMCTAVIYPSIVCFISQVKRTCAEWSEEANQTPRVNRRTIARHELSARECAYIGRDVILLI